MDFRFTEEQEKLRKEIHDFFVSELPSDYRPATCGRRSPTQAQTDYWVGLQKRAGTKGYLAPGWSKESGGLNLTDIEQGVVMEETGYWGVAWPNSLGLRVCGPPLHVFGTEDQKKRFLPPIAKGEVIWYEVFTEPDAGSDEANVSLKVVEDGDEWVLNGQKHFMTAPGPADFLYTLARTADVIPKHRGLSMFLVPAHTKGISYRPLPTMGNFTVEIFFDDVRIPKDALLGELNRGFYHAMVTFEFERTSTGRAATEKRYLEELIQFCKKEKRNGRPLIEDPKIRDYLADMIIDQERNWLGGWFDSWHFSQRQKLGSPPPSTTALQTRRFSDDRAKALMDSLGLYGQLRRTSKYTKFDGQPERAWRTARSTHPAGTFEIQKVVLAGRGLGLPRVPAKFNKQITEALGERG
jgi:alkylation response protein AidB-like acyl-CoA dehydrogenase